MQKRILITVSCSFWILLLLLAGCKHQSSQNQEQESLEEAQTSGDNTNVSKVLYSLPSPTQAAILLKKAGARYEQQFFNPTDNVNKYQSSTDASINLGVYCADLAYCNVFKQYQEAVKYFMTVQKLAGQIGVSNVLQEDILTKLKDSQSDPQTNIRLAADIFGKIDKQLQKNKQQNLSQLILIGGWVEGLYVACEIYRITPKPEIGELIAQQKTSLENMLAMLNANTQASTEIKELTVQLKEIEKLFEPIVITYSFGGTHTDVKKKTTHINNKCDVKFTPAQIESISTKIRSIRNNLVS